MPPKMHRCRGCRRTDEEVGAISRKGYCLTCGQRRMVENIIQQREKSGPFYDLTLERWKQSAAAFGRPETKA